MGSLPSPSRPQAVPTEEFLSPVPFGMSQDDGQGRGHRLWFSGKETEAGSRVARSLGVAFRGGLGRSSGSVTLTELLEAELRLILPQNGDEKLGPTFQGREGRDLGLPCTTPSSRCESNRPGSDCFTWISRRGAAILPAPQLRPGSHTRSSHS